MLYLAVHITIGGRVGGMWGGKIEGVFWVKIGGILRQNRGLNLTN